MRRPVVQFVTVNVDQCVLILRLGEASADSDVLRSLHIEPDALDQLKRAIQARDHLVDRDSFGLAA